MKSVSSAAVIVTLAIGMAASAPLAAQGTGAKGGRVKVEVSKLGPQVGQQVPDFRLPDQNGTVWTRSNVDVEPELAQRFGVRSMPTLLVCSEGDVCGTTAAGRIG